MTLLLSCPPLSIGEGAEGFGAHFSLKSIEGQSQNSIYINWNIRISEK